VKSRSRDGSFGFWSLSLSELSLLLSWRGGMIAGTACCLLGRYRRGARRLVRAWCVV